MNSLTGLDQGHEDIIEVLPDYAVGALDDAQQDHVARHLEECPACRHELQQVLQMVGLLSDAPAPDSATRASLIARARGEEPTTTIPLWEQNVPTPSPLVPAAPVSDERPIYPRPWWRQPAPIAFALAAAVLLLALGITTPWTDRDVTDRDVIAGIIANSTIFSITEGELSPPAEGVLFAQRDESRAVLLAEGLPPLPDDDRYQVWLFTDEGERSSGGFFIPGADGRTEVLIETPQGMSAYAAVAVSAEPAGGSQTPTSPLALGGWLHD